MKSKAIHITISVFTVLIALSVINYLTARHHERLDLTERNLYTLSSSTKEVLKDLQDVVTIRVYFSPGLPPQLTPLRQGVDDMLDEVKSVAGNRVQIEYLDPAATAMVERKTLSLGMVPVQLNVLQDDRVEMAKVYLGMMVLHGDKMEVLPVVQSISNLEYRLTQAIVQVSSPEELILGLWLGKGVMSEDMGGGYDGLVNVLRQRYIVEKIGFDDVDKIDAKELDVLLIASPGNMGSKALDAIDEYMKGGGKLIALVDRWNIQDNMTASPRETDIVGLLKRYGVTISSDMVLDRSNAIASFSGAVMTYHLPYPFWPQVRAEDLSKEDPITGELSSLVFPWTSSILLSADVGARAEVLARSTNMAVLMSGKELRVDPQTAGQKIEKADETASYPLVVRVQGPNDSSLLVVGSGRFAQDDYLQRFNNNLVFVENAVDVFAVGSKLVGIRSRAGTDRPIAILSDARRMTVRLGNVLIGPILVVMIGVVVFLMRRWKRKAVRAEFGR
jgi:ABC-type uncharacterized transport system involved in gliding motility auxiliary subunit